tara:strand:+ start:1529 stop:1786 length:258 start_codon:yes stop_codon:yes gene_type:complete
MHDCCDDCDYLDHLEAQVDMHIDNQIKEAKLTNIAKKNSESKLLIPKTISGNNKTDRVNVDLKDEIYRVGNVKVIARLAPTSSQK